MFDISTITPEQLRKAQALQPQVKSFLASFPMHTGVETTLQCALFCVLQLEPVESQLENLQKEYKFERGE